MSEQMSFADFMESAKSDATPPSQYGKALASLWYDRRGEWDIAHTLAQEADEKDGAWVHAYLHRKEGDEANAGYWYQLAGRAAARGNLAVEWEQIVRALLGGIN